MMIWSTLVNIFAGYLVADFVSGIGHWLEDTYLKTTTPFVGGIAAANQMHHLRPALMCHFTYFQTIKSTLALTLPIYAALAVFGYGLEPFVLSFFACTINVNEIHKWSHMRTKELHWFVQLLQDYRVILNRRDHGIHHRAPNDNQYCVVSGAINYPLDYIGFWRGVEYLIYKSTGVKPRDNDDPDIWATYERMFPGYLAHAKIVPPVHVGVSLHEDGAPVAKTE